MVRRGVPPKKKKRVSDQDRTFIVQLRENDLTLEAIAYRTGFSITTIWRILKDFELTHNVGWANRAKTKHHKARNGEILKMRARGLTLQMIGDEFGLCRERIRQILEQNGSGRHDRSCVTILTN